MVIIWGTTHAGKVDEVPGMFHVVTQFGHLYYKTPFSYYHLTFREIKDINIHLT